MYPEQLRILIEGFCDAGLAFFCIRWAFFATQYFNRMQELDESCDQYRDSLKVAMDERDTATAGMNEARSEADCVSKSLADAEKKYREQLCYTEVQTKINRQLAEKIADYEKAEGPYPSTIIFPLSTIKINGHHAGFARQVTIEKGERTNFGDQRWTVKLEMDQLLDWTQNAPEHVDSRQREKRNFSKPFESKTETRINSKAEEGISKAEAMDIVETAAKWVNGASVPQALRDIEEPAVADDSGKLSLKKLKKAKQKR